MKMSLANVAYFVERLNSVGHPTVVFYAGALEILRLAILSDDDGPLVDFLGHYGLLELTDLEEADDPPNH